ncbi:uncharacterized protein LOC117170215 [Belonocnema kinseyi]|uniref:uncharacterized protein LOC117170215 n=1 Tax=Belonocnema kinseyi TaxID=2817044 RepID=UPI00143CEA75|nr:uncharacterized protein LOC117170215 [Belonocnema kinseyi]
MNIASSILILTFAVYLDFVDCDAGVSPPSPEWTAMTYYSVPLKFKRDPKTRDVIDIELQYNQGARKIERNVGITRVSNPELHLEFVEFVNLITGERIALAPMTAETRKLLDDEKKRIEKYMPKNLKHNKSHQSM